MVSKELLIAILTGLCAMLAWGIADFLAKKSVDKIGNYSTLFWSQLIGSVPLFIFIYLSSGIRFLTAIDLIVLLGLGLLDALSWVYFYKALEKGEVSLLSPVFASWAAITVFISAFIFSEAIPVLQWVALSVIFVGIIFVSFNLQGMKKKAKVVLIKGLPEVLLATLLFSFWVALWGHYINDKPWVFYTFLMRIVVVVSLLLTCRFKKISLTINDKSIWKLLIFIGLFELIAYSSVSYGFSNTTFVSVVAMLSGAFSLPTILLGRIFLKEKMSLIQAIGGVIIVAGVVILSVQ